MADGGARFGGAWRIAAVVALIVAVAVVALALLADRSEPLPFNYEGF